MIDNNSPVWTDSRRVRSAGVRWRRLSRRVLLPLTVLVLLAALTVTGYSRFSGAPASSATPFAWDGSSAYISGGHASGTYTTCIVTPERGQRRVVEVPGSSGGLGLEPWFEGTAKLTCGRSVMVMTGWQSGLYPYASGRPLLVGLAAVAVLAWWCGREPRGRLCDRDPFCG